MTKRKFYIIRILIYFLIAILLYNSRNSINNIVLGLIVFLVLINEIIIAINNHRKITKYKIRVRSNKKLISDLSKEKNKIKNEYNRINSLIEDTSTFSFMENINKYLLSILTSLQQYMSSYICICMIKEDNKFIYKKNIVPEDYNSTAEQKLVYQSFKNSPEKPILKYSDYMLYSFKIIDNMHGVIYFGYKSNNEKYTVVDKTMLKVGVYLISTALINYSQYKNKLEQNKIEFDLRISKEIQKGLLPSKLPDIEMYKLSCYNKSAFIIGGDYYDVKKLNETHYSIVIADVAGKGIPASLYMSMLSALIESELLTNNDTSLIVEHLNKILIHKMKSDYNRFITLFIGILNIKDHILQYTNAGHNPPVLVRNDTHEGIELSTGNMMLGVASDKYITKTIDFKHKDFLILYTDGLTEIISDKKIRVFNLYHDIILERKIYSNPHKRMKQYLNDISDSNSLNDDITLLVLERIK